MTVNQFFGERGGDLMKRKNTSGQNGQGTDLNRNWPEKNWGKAGSSRSPSSDTYMGPSPGSELIPPHGLGAAQRWRRIGRARGNQPTLTAHGGWAPYGVRPGRRPGG